MSTLLLVFVIVAIAAALVFTLVRRESPARVPVRVTRPRVPRRRA
jgi:hypothetical protein